MGKLTGGSFCAKEGQRKVIGGEGRSSVTTAMADGVWGLTSAGVGHGRVHGGMEWVRGEVQWVGARRIEVGRRALAGATNDDGSSSSLRYA